MIVCRFLLMICEKRDSYPMGCFVFFTMVTNHGPPWRNEVGHFCRSKGGRNGETSVGQRGEVLQL